MKTLFQVLSDQIQIETLFYATASLADFPLYPIRDSNTLCIPDNRPDGVTQLELVGVGGGGEVVAELGHDGVEVLIDVIR